MIDPHLEKFQWNGNCKDVRKHVDDFHFCSKKFQSLTNWSKGN